MKKTHIKKLKFHTLFSIFVAIAFICVLLISRDLILGLIMLLLFLYIAGNGIIHTKSNELKKDSLLEYILVSLIVLVIIYSALRN